MVQDSPSRKMDQFIVRLPDGMRDRIKAAADENNRSMNAEIVAVLEEKFPPRPSGDFSLWLSLEKERERIYSKIRSLVEISGNMKTSPEYHKINNDLMNLYKEVDEIRDHQEAVLTPEMLMKIESLFSDGKLGDLVEQSIPLADHPTAQHLTTLIWRDPSDRT